MNATKQRKPRMMLKRYAMAIVLTLFFVTPSVAGDFFAAIKERAEQGDVAAQETLCGMFYFGKNVTQNYEQALKWCTKAAEQGDASAQSTLGLMYQNGHGVPKNYKEALKWYIKAAQQGDAGAQFNLGWTYETGKGTSQNYQEAIKWYTKAAEQGDAWAQFNLGLMHAKGDGVPQSDEQAYIWSSLASAQSSAPENAEKLRDLAAKKLTPEQLATAQQRAAELQKKIAANAKNP